MVNDDTNLMMTAILMILVKNVRLAWTHSTPLNFVLEGGGEGGYKRRGWMGEKGARRARGAKKTDFRDNYLVQRSPGMCRPPPPPFRAITKRKRFFSLMSFPKNHWSENSLALNLLKTFSILWPYNLLLDGLQLKGSTFAWTKSKGVNYDIRPAAFSSSHFVGQMSNVIFLFRFV